MKDTSLIRKIRDCRICAEHLPMGPRPVLQFRSSARIMIVGQAPGVKVHQSGVPWDDASGERLREWMAVESRVFYDPKRIAIVPMGFCYPGRGKSGDLPPRAECAENWMDAVLDLLPNLKLKILIGQYAQHYFLGDQRKRTLTETVKSWKDYSPKVMVLPHPSPRNNIWLKKNAWFEKDVLPALQKTCRTHLR